MGPIYYSQTEMPIEVGDKVLYTRWFLRPLPATVCYISGRVPPHPAIEEGLLERYAICLSDGTVMAY